MFRHDGARDAVACTVWRCFAAVMPDRDIEAYYSLGLERGRLREGGGALEFVRTRELLPCRGRLRSSSMSAAVRGLRGAARCRGLRNALARSGCAACRAGADGRAHGGDGACGCGCRGRAPASVPRRQRPRSVAARAAVSPHRVAGSSGGAARGTPGATRWRSAGGGGGLAVCVYLRPACPGVPGQPALRRNRGARCARRPAPNPEPEARPEWFTTAYFHRPDELKHELKEAGFDVEAVLAVEGPAAFRPSSMPG
jgi:hypothetical protein